MLSEINEPNYIKFVQNTNRSSGLSNFFYNSNILLRFETWTIQMRLEWIIEAKFRTF